MEGIPFRTEQPPRISLYLSNSAPESIFSIDKDGSQIVLLWDYSKKRADVVISDEIPSKIYEYIKDLVDKIHECDIKVEGYFHIGVDYTVIKSPYIYKFRLIEGLEDDKKYPQIKTESEEHLNKTTIIKRTMIVAKNKDSPYYVTQIVHSLYYNKHIRILGEFLIEDLTSMTSDYLYLL